MSTFLRYSGLIFSLLIYSLLGVPAMAQDEAQQKQFQALVTQHLRFPEAGAAVAIIAPRQTAGVVYSGKFNGETVLPLGRLGELFTTVILQHVLAEQKLKRDDPVNDHLEGLRLLESRGEITLQDLLQRSSGLAWRQSGLYVDNPKLGVDLRTLLEQDLKPTVMEPAQVAVSHSMGDLVIGQLLASQYQQKLAEIIQ